MEKKTNETKKEETKELEGVEYIDEEMIEALD
jgi:hypothetical protein